MVTQSNADESHALPNLAAEWARWKQIVRDSPDVRDDKITSTRESLATGAYEYDEVLDATLDRISAELNVRLND